jgi:predicted ATP-dependent endonuclease of OLD family
MRITKLQIKNYKNLDAELTHNSDIIAFIGNNGSGKSNLLEAVSHIFRSLYVSKYKIDFDYYIEYETSKKNKITIEKNGKDRSYSLDNVIINDLSNYLPQKVVAIYSGEEARLFDDCFGPFYLEFVNNINKAQLQGTEYSELPRMLFLNKFYWNISLLSLLVSNSEDNKKFIEEVLKIIKVDRIKIDFIKRNYEKYNDNKALRLVRDIDTKAEYDLEELKKLLLEKGYIADDLYKYLYLAYSPKDSKIINDIIIEFNENLTVADLSEGEKKLLLIKGALEFAGQEDSIFILDEPDSHIHINNKEQITKSFEPYQHNRQIIISTHSPTLTQCLNDDNVYMLNSGKIEDKNKQEIIKDISGEFWNKHQQNSFLSSKKPIILFVEGYHDKTHINNAFSKLKNEYPELKFDVISVDGAANIPQLMTGLRTSDIKLNKIFIAIFDNDDEGKDNCNKTQVSYPGNPNKEQQKGFYAIKYENDKKIAKGDGFTVENMFDSKHYEEAYKEAFESQIGKFENKFIDKISKEIKDQAKSILSKKSKDFDIDDFKSFRKLFDLILEIKNLNVVKVNPINDPKVAIQDRKLEQKEDLIINQDTVIIPPIDKKVFEHHIKYTSKKTWDNFLKIREELLKLNPGIVFGPNKYFISLYNPKQNFAVIRFRRNSLNLEVKRSEKFVKKLLPNRNTHKNVNGTNIGNIYETEDFTDVINMLFEVSKSVKVKV